MFQTGGMPARRAGIRKVYSDREDKHLMIEAVLVFSIGYAVDRAQRGPASYQ